MAATMEVFRARLDCVPEAGQLVRVRGQQSVVSAVVRSHQPVDELAASTLPGQNLVRLTSVNDDDLGEELTVVWKVELGREIVPATKLPEVAGYGWDDPQRLGAFLDTSRLGTVTGADTQTLQALFRSGHRVSARRCVRPASLLFRFMLHATGS